MIEVLESFGPRVNAITHTAPHHADEVFATVMLSFLFDVVLYRTRDKSIIDSSDAIVYDVGNEFDPKRKRFDHHQKNFSESRRDGIKYSSAGLIWREYGVEIVKKLSNGEVTDDSMAKSVADRIDRNLVKGIDARDNGQSGKESVMSISAIISLIRPRWDKEDTSDSNSYFLEACKMADITLRYVVNNAIATEYGVREVTKKLRTINGQTLILDKFIGGWEEAVLRSDLLGARNLLYVIFPALSGNWNVQAILKSPSESKESRKPFPESWRALNGEELAKITGVESAVFCHKEGFVAAAKTKEDAIKLAEKAIAA